MCGTKEILLKSWKKPHNLSPILAPAPGTPGNPGKNLTICGPSPGPPEILEKTSQSADHPLDLRKSWKNLTICGPSPGPRKSWKKTSQYYGFACWLLLLVVGSDKLCRGPLRGQKNYEFSECLKAMKNDHFLLRLLKVCICAFSRPPERKRPLKCLFFAPPAVMFNSKTAGE